MNIDQPLCSFNYCKKYADGNCRASVGIREGCEFRVYEEKQIPKEPEFIDRDAGCFECSVCGMLVYCSDEPESHKYCLGCGQALKWD